MPAGLSDTIVTMQQPKKVLALVGMPGAGKTYCVDYLKQKGWPSVYFGGVVVDETIRRYGSTTPEKEKLVREEFRTKEGTAAIARRIIPQIDELLTRHPYVVADGLYSWSEYKLFKEHYGDNAVIVAITAPRLVRHQRLKHRPVRPLTDEEATAREYAEIESIEKGGPIANADYTIVNDDTPEAMYAKLEDVLANAGFIS